MHGPDLAIGTPTGPRDGIGVLELERVAARGWQPTTTASLGDWLLRAGAGFTGRANSVLPLASPGLTVSAAVSEVELFYRRQQLPALFQIPRCDETGLLEGYLDDHGWQPFNPTLLLVGDVADAADRCPPVRGWPPAVFERRPSGKWLARYAYRGSALPPSAATILQNADPVVFGSVVQPGMDDHHGERDGVRQDVPWPDGTGQDVAGQDVAGPGLAGQDAAAQDPIRRGEVVAVVRGALTDGWLGVTALTVDPSRRRSGAGRHLMGELLRWAGNRGAHHCYLQVAADNEAALALYSRLGFSPHHRYHYRRRPIP